MTAKAAVWLRVSTDHQETSNQAAGIERVCGQRGYTVTRTFELSASAWNGGKDGGAYRSVLAGAIDAAHRGEFSILVVWALDRLSRGGAEDTLRIIRQFRERGVSIVSVQESWLSGNPEIQDVLVAFAGWLAQQESARRSERIRAGLARRKSEGRTVGGRVAGAKDKRPRRSAGVKAAWTPERRAALADRNRQRAAGDVPDGP